MRVQLDPRGFKTITSTDLELTIREYLIALRQAGRSDHTIEKYGSHLDRLATWLRQNGVTQPRRITKALLREWGAELHERPSPRTGKPWSPATIKQAVCAVRSFLAWCRDERIINKNLKKALNVPKVEKGEQRTLDIFEATAAIASLDDSTIKGQRDTALLSLMLDSGLRSAELCRLQVRDLRFGVQLLDPMTQQIIEINLLTVIRKGSKQQKKVAYFGPETAARLRNWLQIRPQVIKSEDIQEVFVSLGGTRPGTALTRDGLRVIFRNLANNAGIDHFSPHALRRSFASLMNQAGAPSRTIQLFGAWSSIGEVETYTRNMQIAYQYPQFSPVSLLEKIRPGN